MRLGTKVLAAVMAIATISAHDCSAAPEHYVLVGTVTHPEPARSNPFGDIKIADDYLLVSAPAVSRPGDASQVFLYDVTGQHLLHTFEDPTPESLGFGGSFGDVAIDGKHVVISDYNTNHAVYIYDAEDAQLRHTLSSPIADHPAFPGGEIAVSGNNVVVGAYALSPCSQCEVFPAAIFIFDAFLGEVRHTLSPPADSVAWDWGDFFDVSGDTIAVGTFSDFNTAAMLYNAQTGEQIGKIANPQGKEFDYVKIQGNKVLLGNNLGETFLFDTTGNLLDTFAYPSNILQGSSSLLDFSGQNVLIGSSGHYDANEMVAPALWLYDGASGELIQHFVDAPPGDRYLGIVSNPSGSHIAVRNRDNQVLIYARVPEPATLSLLPLVMPFVTRWRRFSRGT